MLGLEAVIYVVLRKVTVVTAGYRAEVGFRSILVRILLVSLLVSIIIESVKLVLPILTLLVLILLVRLCWCVCMSLVLRMTT